MRGFYSPRKTPAAVAQSVERILGKDEVRQFKSAQQLQQKKDPCKGPFSVFCVKCRLELSERGRQRECPVDIRVGHGSQATVWGAKTGGLAKQGRSSLLSSSEKVDECRPADLLCKAAQVCSAARGNNIDSSSEK